MSVAQISDYVCFDAQCDVLPSFVYLLIMIFLEFFIIDYV